MPNNFYKFKLKDEEPLIIQGDIFRNLPFYTSNFLVNLDKDKPSTTKIIKKIIKKEQPKLVESFLIPRWGILASQDCDILPNFDLIFYPIIKTKNSKEGNNNDIKKFIDNSIRNTTRSFYLPIIKSEENKLQKGPFHVLFQNPFIVPYNILIEDDVYSKCWVARIIEPANRVFIGKLTNFFSRTPIDEAIFLENYEISLLISRYWEKEIWKEPKKRIDHNEFNKIFNKINEIINLLIIIDRKTDINEICFFNKKFINLIVEKLSLLTLENQVPHIDDIIKDCKEILNDKMGGACEKMRNILNNIYLEENSLMKQYHNPEIQKRFNDNINKLKEGEEIPSISRVKFKNQNEIKGYGFKIEKALKELQLYDEIAPKYLELTQYLEKFTTTSYQKE